MPTVSIAGLQKKQQYFNALRNRRLPWWNIWRDLADYYHPKRYQWLLSDAERTTNSFTNPLIANGTGTLAARTLAAGLMNGIASPARPWFKFRLSDFSDTVSHASRVWLDEVERRMRYAIAESNFYNCLGVWFFDLSVFGTASMSIFDDDEKVFHCQNHALGEYYLDVDNKGRVCVNGREFVYTVYQTVREFGEENCSPRVRDAYKTGGARLNESVKIAHLIEPNLDDFGGVPKSFEYREVYWELENKDENRSGVQLLRAKGYSEKPVITGRWEVAGNDAYGSSCPGLDALGDVKQLQHETKTKAKGMDKMVSPPILADVQLENKPFALLPNGITYVARLDATNGAKPIYEVNLPVGEMTQDILMIEQRIRDAFYNFLFNKVSSLPTVRSAREIDAIEGEKLVLLGPTLERVENEGLDPALNRIFNLMQRKGMFPPAPPEIRGKNLQIQYVSIIAAAQSAAGTTATERFLQFTAQLASIWPEAREVPEIVDTVADYGRDLGVSAKNLRSREQIAEVINAGKEQAQQAQATAQLSEIAAGAKNLSQADVGGGENVLQRLLQGGGA